MRAVDIIIKKRDHQELTRQEIDFFIQGYTNGQIPDYQAAAFAMAVLLNNMTPRETTDLTLAMAATGDTLGVGQHYDFQQQPGVIGRSSIVIIAVVDIEGAQIQFVIYEI